MVTGRWSEESVKLALVDSNTYGDVLEKLGLKAIGHNNKTLQKYLALYGLVFTSKPHLNRRYTSRSNDDIFVADCTTVRHVVKQRIISHNLLPYVCGGCGLTDTWNGQKLVLQLEHINGLRDDNRLSNLEFLCPNCHSQTSTWAGRNKK